MNYANHMQTKQTEQALGRPDQVKNAAGGFVFAIDKWARLNRFLVLGSEGGTFYVGERELTRENAKCVLECVAEDARKLVDVLVDFSVNSRAPSQTETFFALALALENTKGQDRRYASEAIPKICRTGSHILQLASMFTKLTGRRVGSSRALASGFKDWYESKTTSDLCFQTTKYPQRDGWSHGNLIRAVHPSPKTHFNGGHESGSSVDELMTRETLFGYLTDNVPAADVQGLVGLEMLDAKLRMHAATNVTEVISVLETTRATWEMVPTQFLNEPVLWAKFLDSGVPMTALMRNLGRLSTIGLLKPLSSIERAVCVQLTDPERVAKARLHPYNVLVTQRVYASGRGFKGSGSWSVSQEVVEALEATFDASFGNIEPAGTRHLLALDVSGSMGSAMRNGPLSCYEGSAAMAVIQKRSEPACHTMAFTHGFHDLAITRRDSLSEVLKRTRGLPHQATDCAIPMLWAGNNRIEVDTFVIYTDNETWYGQVHPYEALRAYRQAMGIDAKLIVVAFTATNRTIADPADAGMLDIVGFDSATPNLISAFARGGI